MENHHLRFEIEVPFWNTSKARIKLNLIQEVVDYHTEKGIVSLEVEEHNNILMTKFVLFVICEDVELGHGFYHDIKKIIENENEL
jgi:hypothetical protein